MEDSSKRSQHIRPHHVETPVRLPKLNKETGKYQDGRRLGNTKRGCEGKVMDNTSDVLIAEPSSDSRWVHCIHLRGNIIGKGMISICFTLIYGLIS